MGPSFRWDDIVDWAYFMRSRQLDFLCLIATRSGRANPPMLVDFGAETSERGKHGSS